MLNKEALRETLVEKYDYKNSQVDNVVEKIGKFSPKVDASFEKWLDTGEVDGIEVEGYTVKAIVELKKLKVVAAYLMLDWLEREPARAKAALGLPNEFKNTAANR